MMDLSIDIDAKSLNLPKGFTKGIVNLMGVTAAGFIKERTQLKKVDVNGKRFIRYSPSYRKVRNRNRLNESPVDLTFTGEMVGSVNVLGSKVSKKHFELIVGPSASSKPVKGKKGKTGLPTFKDRPSNNEIAYYLATGSRPRIFVGLQMEEVRKITDLVGSLFAKGIKNPKQARIIK